MARRKRTAEMRLSRWLTWLSIVIGLLATLSYAVGAHMAVRYFFPAAGAWWNEHEFAFMETSAAALGILVAIRAGARLIGAGTPRRPAVIAALVAGVVLLPAISALSAQLARLGWTAGGGVIREHLTAAAGYSAGIIIDKVAIASVYFLKTAGFAWIAGLALLALAAAVFMTAGESAPGPSGAKTQ
jgi:hypothetical protein